MKKAITFGILALLVFGLVASTGAVSAFGVNSEAVKQALKTGDYNAWKQAMTEEKAERFSEERFNKLVEMQEKMQAVEQALEAGDYDAWKTAIEKLGGQSEITEKITKENFGKFVELHNTMKKAEELREELGIKIGSQKMKGFGRRGFGNGFQRGPRGRMRSNCPFAGEQSE